MNLGNTIDDMHLEKGSHLNVEDTHAAKVSHFEREQGADVKFGKGVSKNDEKKMLNKMIHGNQAEMKKEGADKMSLSSGIKET